MESHGTLAPAQASLNTHRPARPPLCCHPQTGGPYGGYKTEMEFYRAMGRTSRNNPLLIILAGLFAIPTISAVTSLING